MHLHEGVTVNMNGQEWVIPPLTLKHLKALSSDLDRVSGFGNNPVPSGMSSEVIESIMAIVYAALSRNYPDLKLEALGEMLDLGNMARVMNAVMGVSGLSPKPGE